MPSGKENAVDGPAVRIWLSAVLGMVFAMVVVGGVTRLTGSGLSMVEWRPLMGTLPPMGEDAWLAVFERYQQSPQYQQVNDWMTLGDFQRIFFWEYVHRLLGRLVGIVAGLPCLYFIVRNRMSRPVRWRAILAIVFGGAQGLLGWFMVKSGLVDVPEVSHFRLAAHLLLAFFVGMWIVWILLELRAPAGSARGIKTSPTLARIAWGLVAITALQIAYGAFMAGTHAGLLFSTFPHMNGAYLPTPFFAPGRSLVRNLVETPAVIHWVHRSLAYAVALYALGVGHVLMRKGARGSDAWWAGVVLSAVVALQVLLGILTVIWAVPLWLAASHQAVAFVLAVTVVFVAHMLMPARNRTT